MSDTSQVQTLHLVFDEDDGEKGINVRDLADFLQLLRTAYISSLKIKDEIPKEILKNDISVLSSRDIKNLSINNNLFSIYPDDVFEEIDKEEDLLILGIKKESPLEVWIMGVVSALSIAVIISGGEVELPFLKARLPPLGKGVYELRKALKMREPKE